MSYLKSSYNVCAFEVPKELNLSQSKIHEKLLAKKFVELTPSQEQGFGWVSANDIFKSDFSLDDSVARTSLVGGYRYDVKVVPKALIKKLYRERLKERIKDG